MYSTFLTTLTGTSIFLRKKSSELVNSKANKREGSGHYKLKTTSYLKAEHTYEAESADHAVQLRPWFCSVFPRGKIETLKQSLTFLEKSCCCLRKFSQEHSCLPIWYERLFCFTVSYSTHPSPMFSMFMKLFKQDPQLLGPGHVVLHSWPRIPKSFISRTPPGSTHRWWSIRTWRPGWKNLCLCPAAIQPIQTSKHDKLSLRR